MNKSKSMIAAILLILVGVGLVWMNTEKQVADSGSRHGAEPVRIGAILPLSGDAAQYGNNDREGIMLAVEQANREGGINGRKIEVLFEDSRTEGKLAISAFNKLRSQGVSSIIDNAVSTISLALVPMLESNKTVLISTGSTNPALSGASPYFFRVWNSDAYEGKVAADFVGKQGDGKKIAVLYINNEYGKGLKEVFVREVPASSASIVLQESFDKKLVEYRSLAAKVKVMDPDWIYIIGYASQTGVLTKKLKEEEVSGKILGTVAMEDPEYLKIAGAAAEGVIYPFPKAPEGDVVKQFREAFKKRYGKEPGLLHDVAYDAANLIIRAMRQQGTDGESVRKVLSKVKEYQGASGVITFDKNGDVSKPMVMKTIANGKFVILK